MTQLTFTRKRPGIAPPPPRPPAQREALPRTLSLAVASFLLPFVACGTPPVHGSSTDELDSVELTRSPGWPAAVTSRSVPASFRTRITALDVDPRGKVWLLREETSAPSQLNGTPLLERYGPAGHLERQIGFPERSRVTGFAIHPSGALSVFVLRDDEGHMQYRLEIVRLSPEGDTVATTRFEELPGPRENLYYDDAGVHELPVDRPFTLSWTSHVLGVPDGEGLYLLAEWTYGFKLYRVDAMDRRLWGAQVMPANLGMAFELSPSLIAVDGEAVYVATQIFQDDVPIYGQHFGRAALSPLGSYDVLVQRFDADGTFGGARLFGGTAVDHPSAMTVHDGLVLVAGAARITKHALSNRTMEWDLAIMRGRVDEGASQEYLTIDVARDDFGWALAPRRDGRFVVGGRMDYVQVDTNSEVENGKGLLLGLGPDLSQESVLELSLPRDVQIRAMRALPGGDIVLAGTRDGPLTHTEPSMTDNDGFWGIAHLAGR